MQSILCLVPDFIGPPGGIARYCRFVYRALIDSGKQPLVLALNDHETIADRVQMGIEPEHYIPYRKFRSLFLVGAFTAIVRMRPDIILVGHVNFALVGWLLGRLSGARVIVMAYGVDVWSQLSMPRRWGLCHADRVLAISDFTARRMIETNAVSVKRVRLLYNCLDPMFMESCGGAKDRLSILTVARIERSEGYKGHEIVIRAMPELLGRFPELVYDIVGDGAGRQELEVLATALGVADAVRFHGVVTEEALRQFYADAAVFVMPSYREGFGFVFIEAMAQGVPAIGGNLDATPEVISDGETGYVVDPHSVEAVGEAIARLLADEGLRTRMGQAAIAHVQQRFSYSSFQRTLRDYLQELM